MDAHEHTPPDPVPRRVHTSARLDPDVYEALAEDAAEHGRTVAQTIRHHLRRALGMAA